MSGTLLVFINWNEIVLFPPQIKNSPEALLADRSRHLVLKLIIRATEQDGVVIVL
jgi:hypothetical protein